MDISKLLENALMTNLTSGKKDTLVSEIQQMIKSGQLSDAAVSNIDVFGDEKVTSKVTGLIKSIKLGKNVSTELDDLTGYIKSFSSEEGEKPEEGEGSTEEMSTDKPEKKPEDELKGEEKSDPAKDEEVNASEETVDVNASDPSKTTVELAIAPKIEPAAVSEEIAPKKDFSDEIEGLRKIILNLSEKVDSIIGGAPKSEEVPKEEHKTEFAEDEYLHLVNIPTPSVKSKSHDELIQVLNDNKIEHKQKKTDGNEVAIYVKKDKLGEANKLISKFNFSEPVSVSHFSEESTQIFSKIAEAIVSNNSVDLDIAISEFNQLFSDTGLQLNFSEPKSEEFSESTIDESSDEEVHFHLKALSEKIKGPKDMKTNLDYLGIKVGN